MPSPITPNDLKELLNDTGGSFCDKFLRLLKGFPEAVYGILLYERNEDGTISDEMKDDICALECAGGNGSGGGGSSLSAPTNVSATDGTLGDRVRITWGAVTGATSYEIFRRDTSDSSGSTIIGTSTTATFDDTTAVDDTVYYYWIKAVNATLDQRSAFSAPDTGYVSTELDAVSTLDASQGFGMRGPFVSTGQESYKVALVWTPVQGANAYSIYRGTTNVFAASTTTLIDADRVPFVHSNTTTSVGPAPYFLDQGGELVYYDAPPVTTSKFYYWVKARRTTSPQATSAESNVAQGWAYGAADGSTLVSEWTIPSSGGVSTAPVGATKAWIVFFGNGAGGAGGNGAVGGGGGGGGAVCWGEITVTAGDEFQITHTVAAAGNAAASTNGGAGPQSDLEYKPLAGAYAMVMRSTAAAGGVFSAAGGGAGGAASVGSTTGVTNPQTRDGRKGEAGSGNAGGRGGYNFGLLRIRAGHATGASGFNTGDSAQGGGGSYAVGSFPPLATGGNNVSGSTRARALIIYSA